MQCFMLKADKQTRAGWSVSCSSQRSFFFPGTRSEHFWPLNKKILSIQAYFVLCEIQKKEIDTCMYSSTNAWISRNKYTPPRRRVAIVYLSEDRGVSAEGEINEWEESERRSDSQVPSHLARIKELSPFFQSSLQSRSVTLCLEKLSNNYLAVLNTFSHFSMLGNTNLPWACPWMPVLFFCLPFRLLPAALDRAPRSPDNKPQGGAAFARPFNHVL